MENCQTDRQTDEQSHDFYMGHATHTANLNLPCWQYHEGGEPLLHRRVFPQLWMDQHGVLAAGLAPNNRQHHYTTALQNILQASGSTDCTNISDINIRNFIGLHRNVAQIKN
jgi:hypothetical protein